MTSTQKIFQAILIMNKLVVCGEFIWPWYQEAAASALERNGNNVFRFGWFEYLYKWSPDKSEPIFKSFFHRLAFKFQKGPFINKINKDFIDYIDKVKPDTIILYHAILIRPSTIKHIKKNYKTLIVQYTPDNPFSKKANKLYWKNYINSIHIADYTTPHRKKNIVDIKKYGGKILNDFILMPYFIPEKEYPISQDKIPKKYICDVVFAGHFENDNRVECIESLLKSGYKVNLFGGGWNEAAGFLSKMSPIHDLLPTEPVVGKDYLYALNGAKICLCFYSKLNEDSYTTRVFQIPATKSAMFSEDSEDIKKILKEDHEVVIFRNQDELNSKVRHYLNNPRLLDEISLNAYKRMFTDEHDISSRMNKWMVSIDDYR